jgi:hypothetical protein
LAQDLVTCITGDSELEGVYPLRQWRHRQKGEDESDTEESVWWKDDDASDDGDASDASSSSGHASADEEEAEEQAAQLAAWRLQAHEDAFLTGAYGGGDDDEDVSDDSAAKEARVGCVFGLHRQSDGAYTVARFVDDGDELCCKSVDEARSDDGCSVWRACAYSPRAVSLFLRAGVTFPFVPRFAKEWRVPREASGGESRRDVACVRGMRGSPRRRLTLACTTLPQDGLTAADFAVSRAARELLVSAPSGASASLSACCVVCFLALSLLCSRAD